jgi:hypothetical protein
MPIAAGVRVADRTSLKREDNGRRRRGGGKRKEEEEEKKAGKAPIRKSYEAAGADWLLPKHAAVRPHQAWHRGVL